LSTLSFTHLFSYLCSGVAYKIYFLYAKAQRREDHVATRFSRL